MNIDYRNLTLSSTPATHRIRFRGVFYRNRQIILSVLSFLLLTSCAYRFGQELVLIPGQHKRISLPIFANETRYVGFETYFSRALARQLSRSTQVSIVPLSQASAQLIGTILLIEEKPRAFKNSGSLRLLPRDTFLASEYVLKMKINLVLQSHPEKVVLWKEEFVAEQTYSGPLIGQPRLNTANANYLVGERKIAANQLAQRMTTEALNVLMEAF